jgi:hypothetical protein
VLGIGAALAVRGMLPLAAETEASLRMSGIVGLVVAAVVLGIIAARSRKLPVAESAT